MSGYESEADAIQAYFFAQWADRTPVGYPGNNFAPVDESVQLDILGGQGQQMSVGSPGTNLARYPGVLAARVYVTKGRNAVQSREIVDPICDIFRNARVSGIRFGIPYVSGTETDETWRVTTVMCPFVRDELHA